MGKNTKWIKDVVDKWEAMQSDHNNRKTDYYLNGNRLGKGEDAMRPVCPCTQVAESKRAGAAGGEEGKCYVGLHCEKI